MERSCGAVGSVNERVNGDAFDDVQTHEITIPIIELSNVQMRVARSPQHPGMTFLHFGPVILSVALQDEGRAQLVKGLTGVELPPRMDVPKS